MAIPVPGGPGSGNALPVSTGVTTLASLIASIRRRLGDTKQLATQTEEGDGTKTNWRLADAPMEDLVVEVDGALSYDWTVDTDSGWVTFGSAPGSGLAIRFSYQYYVWSEDHIIEAVNNAVAELFGNFYVEGYHDDIATTGDQEYVLQDGAHVNLPPQTRITKVEFWSDPHWIRLEGWSIRNTETTKILHFENALVPGYYLRVTYHAWPGFFDSVNDTLESSIGLPTRAKEPIILFAMSDLLGDRLGPRVRGDLGHNTQNENQVKSYEIQNDAAWYRSRAEMKARRLKMAPLTTRIVP